MESPRVPIPHPIQPSRRGDEYKFALSGSCVRKLRRLDVNLLAGRVIERAMFPLAARELGSDFDLDAVLRFGSLPGIYTDAEYRVEKLRAYVHIYLRQEIQQEALVKDLGSFHRFLRIAALMHGQVVNQAAMARDAAVARTTVQRFFDTLVDTLVGTLLPAWQAKAKVREHGKPKFYFFDPGVVRAIRDVADEPLFDVESGTLLEGFILHELRAAIAYQGLGGELSYWSTPGSKEIDFIWTKGTKLLLSRSRTPARGEPSTPRPSVRRHRPPDGGTRPAVCRDRRSSNSIVDNVLNNNGTTTLRG